jgi:diacylglycerol kinase (ATP)
MMLDTSPTTAAERPHDLPAHVPERCAMLINARSFHLSQRDRAWQLQTRAERVGVAAVRVHDRDSVGAALDDAISANVGLIAIAGGDGTIQAALTHLTERHAADAGRRLPNLMVLGGGRTNLTPRDFGARGGPLATFERAWRGAVPLQRIRRRVLTLSQPGHAAHSGFFVAGSLVDHLIRACHQYRAAGDGPLRDGVPSTAWFLARTAVQRLAGQYYYAPPVLAVDAASLGTLAGPMPVFLCTTLDHAGDLVNPYARRGAGPLRVTAIRSQARDFWWRIPRIVRGRFTSRMHRDAGYLSGRCTRLAVTGLRSISLDGQEFDLDPNLPLTIEPGPQFEFLQP